MVAKDQHFFKDTIISLNLFLWVSQPGNSEVWSQSLGHPVGCGPTLPKFCRDSWRFLLRQVWQSHKPNGISLSNLCWGGKLRILEDFCQSFSPEFQTTLQLNKINARYNWQKRFWPKKKKEFSLAQIPLTSVRDWEFLHLFAEFLVPDFSSIWKTCFTGSSKEFWVRCKPIQKGEIYC